MFSLKQAASARKQQRSSQINQRALTLFSLAPALPAMAEFTILEALILELLVKPGTIDFLSTIFTICFSNILCLSSLSMDFFPFLLLGSFLSLSLDSSCGGVHDLFPSPGDVTPPMGGTWHPGVVLVAVEERVPGVAGMVQVVPAQLPGGDTHVKELMGGCCCCCCCWGVFGDSGSLLIVATAAPAVAAAVGVLWLFKETTCACNIQKNNSGFRHQVKLQHSMFIINAILIGSIQW